MKKRNYLTFSTLIIALFIINSSVAQTSNSSSVAIPNGESWLPVNEFNFPEAKKQNGNNIVVLAPLKNVLDGVSFYTMNTTCNSDKVILLKLINTNDYAVDIEWQLKPDEDKVLIRIPANKSYEGNCSSKDEVISMLVVNNYDDLDNTNTKNYLFKSVKVLNKK